MRVGVAIAAQGNEVMRGICAALAARNGVVYLQALRGIAQGAAVAVAAVYLAACGAFDVRVHGEASFAFSTKGARKVKGGRGSLPESRAGADRPPALPRPASGAATRTRAPGRGKAKAKPGRGGVNLCRPLVQPLTRAQNGRGAKERPHPVFSTNICSFQPPPYPRKVA